METLGWNVLLVALKWVFIGLVYFVLVIIFLNVRREMTMRSKSAPAEEAGFSPGRLRVVSKGSDPKMRPGLVLDLKPVTSLGALPDNQVVLRDKFISGHHARLTWDGVGWTIIDLGSRNGTSVNNERVGANAPKRLKNGSMIALGDMTFELLE